MAHLRTAEPQLQTIKMQWQTSTSELNEQRVQQRLVASLIKQFRNVESHLNNVFSASTLLVDEMTKLTAVDALGITTASESVHEIHTNLQRLIEKLPRMSLNAMGLMENSTDSDSDCHLFLNRRCTSVHAKISPEPNLVDTEENSGLLLERGNDFNYPLGSDVDGRQTVLIADQFNHSIQAWKKGTTTTGTIVAGGHGKESEPNQFNVLTDVVVDQATNSLIACDADNRRVMQWSRTVGTTTDKVLMTNISCFGVTQDKYGSLYVTDTKKNEVRRYAKGKFIGGTIVAGGNRQGLGLNQLFLPLNVAVDRDSLIVCDYYIERVMRWLRQNGSDGQVILENISCEGLALDDQRNLYVSEWRRAEVRRYRVGD